MGFSGFLVLVSALGGAIMALYVTVSLSEVRSTDAGMRHLRMLCLVAGLSGCALGWAALLALAWGLLQI